MATLITRHSHSLNIFLNCGIYYFLNRTVMTKVYDFYACILEYSAHDIYGCVMAIKKGCSRNGPDMMFWPVYFNFNTHAHSYIFWIVFRNSMPVA